MHNENIIKLRAIEAEIRSKPDANYHEISAAQSAAQSAASLEEADKLRAPAAPPAPVIPADAIQVPETTG